MEILKTNFSKAKANFRRYEGWFATYKLTIRTGLTLILLTFLSCLVLYSYVEFSVNRARAVRSDLFDRDLRDLASRFDADEKFVLENNVRSLLNGTRQISPLLLPRQYYTAIPSSKMYALPRQPPRNCFINLALQGQSGEAAQTADRFCSYFVGNETLGQFMFFTADLQDRTILPLQYGDPRLIGDALRLSLTYGAQEATWWVAFLRVNKADSERYEISAYRELPNGIKERDRRLEGWAYTQRQPDGTQVLRVLARLDFKQFIKNSNEIWPPSGWRDIKIRLKRRDFTSPTSPPRIVQYSEIGTSNLSLTSLASTIFSARASLSIESAEKNGLISRSLRVSDPQSSVDWNDDSLVKIVDGDIIVSSNPLVRSQSLQDTNLYLRVRHPGIVIEKDVWRVVVLMLFLTAVAITAVFYFYSRLLKPVFVLTKQARKLIASGTEGERLPYASRKDEIGILASRFNELIVKIREQVARELNDRTMREAAENQRLKTVLRNREENLNIIGHEIRSPLQALVNLHPSGTDARRYIDRILSALPHLQLGLSAEDAVAARDIELETVNIYEFLAEIARNASLVNVPNVVLINEADSLHCDVDPDALGDVLENILRNANRHRQPGTEIEIGILQIDSDAVISITNYGDPIESEIHNRIFEYGFSTVPKSTGDGNGIGLWISRKYIAMMRGSLTAKNKIEDGSVCFEIRLPIIDSFQGKPI